MADKTIYSDERNSRPIPGTLTGDSIAGKSCVRGDCSCCKLGNQTVFNALQDPPVLEHLQVLSFTQEELVRILLWTHHAASASIGHSHLLGDLVGGYENNGQF